MKSPTPREIHRADSPWAALGQVICAKGFRIPTGRDEQAGPGWPGAGHGGEAGAASPAGVSTRDGGARAALTGPAATLMRSKSPAEDHAVDPALRRARRRWAGVVRSAPDSPEPVAADTAGALRPQQSFGGSGGRVARRRGPAPLLPARAGTPALLAGYWTSKGWKARPESQWTDATYGEWMAGSSPPLSGGLGWVSWVGVAGGGVSQTLGRWRRAGWRRPRRRKAAAKSEAAAAREPAPHYPLGPSPPLSGISRAQSSGHALLTADAGAGRRAVILVCWQTVHLSA